MKPAVSFAVLMAMVTTGAAALRLASLDNRPMHGDEANQTVKFGRLLEQGDYVYDPHEHHGPSLSYLGLPIARVAHRQTLAEVTETQLRLLPAIFGIALVGMAWLLRDGLSQAAALAAAVLTAVSPAMVFYSRYYIQEMLLVCFTFGAIVALWRYARRVAPITTEASPTGPRSRPAEILWLVLLGLCAGMMHASKETCLIALSAMALAAVLALPGLRRTGAKRLAVAGVVVVLTAASISALLFSSFFDNPRGVADSIATYFDYARRASGEGSVGRHVYPPDYYFRILFWWQRGTGPVWTEGSIAALALVGLAAGILGKLPKTIDRSLVCFLGVYTVLMTLLYSALPYKTPWCALGFLHGMILLGGVGATVLVHAMPGRTWKAATITLLAAAIAHLGWQAHRASFVDYAHPDNPYVYAHTTEDVPRLARRIEQIAASHPDGHAMHVQVICPDHDYWPLPWYLRRFGRVGWFDGIPEGLPAPVIVTQPITAGAVLEYIYQSPPPGQRHLYRQLGATPEGRDWQLRPHVPLQVYVRRDL